MWLDWVNTIAQVGLAGSVGAGVWIARGQLNAQREDAYQRRKAELAEEMIVLARQIEDSFRHFRNVFDSIPEEKQGNRIYYYNQRLERIQSSETLFQKFREFQIRCDAVMPEYPIKEYVSDLINCRTEVAFAAVDLRRDALEARSRADAAGLENAERALHGTWSDSDDLGNRISRNVESIVSKLERHAKFI